MFGKREGTVFGNIAFTAEEQQRTDAYLRQKLNSNFLSRRPGPGGRRLTYLESCKAIEIANEAFGFNGWSCRIVDCNIECKEKADDGRWTIIYSSVVRIELKDGTCHEDVGFGQSEGLRDLGAALDQAKKASISDARKRALRLFGEYLGNSCYDKEHIRDVAANRANQATLQSPTSIKLENANTSGAVNTPPLHPQRAIENNPPSENAPGFQPPPKPSPQVASGISINRPPAHQSLPVQSPPQPSANAPTNMPRVPRAPSVGPLVVGSTNQPNTNTGSPMVKTEPKRHNHPPFVPPKPISVPSMDNQGQRAQPAPQFSAGPTHTAPYHANPPATFVRPTATNVSPSMIFNQNGDDAQRKRALGAYAAMEDLEGIRMSQFDFDDQKETKRTRM